MKKPRGKDRIILAAEEAFARAVALGMVIKRQTSAWHVLIPGMFLLEIFRRNVAIRRYTEIFLFPRKCALETARLLTDGQIEEKHALERAEHRIQVWLRSLDAFSCPVHQGHMKQFTALLSHYKRLLRAEGNSYYSLLRDAYGSRVAYEAFLSELEAAEGQIDQAIAEKFGRDPKVLQRLDAEKKQVAIQRKREIENAF